MQDVSVHADTTVAEPAPTPWARGGPWLLWIGVGLAALWALYAAQRYDYLLFHGVVELSSAVVAAAVFTLAWHSRRYGSSDFLLWIGVAYLFASILDLVHALVYRGMNVVPGLGANEPTQLWIAARGMQAVSLVLAAALLRRRTRPGVLVAAYASLTTLILLSIFAWRNFPVCYDDSLHQLTPFKIGAEYVISGLMLLSIGLLLGQRGRLDGTVVRLMVASIAVTIVSELSFTLYQDPFGPANLIGHYLKIIAYFLVYRALVVTGLERPYDLLFRDLKQAEQNLRQLNETLEMRVAERTEQLRALTLELAQAEQRERRRLAEVLHDHLQQDLAAALMQVGLAAKGPLDDQQTRAVAQVRELIAEAIHLSRCLSVELNPPMLRECGLAGALQWLAEHMQERHGLTVAVETEEGPEPATEEVRGLLVQAVRELLFNVVKHAEVERATVVLHQKEQALEIIVQDQGRGWNPEAGQCGGGHFGLATIRSRLEVLGGEMEITGGPGTGTCVTLRVPTGAAAPVSGVVDGAGAGG